MQDSSSSLEKNPSSHSVFWGHANEAKDLYALDYLAKRLLLIETDIQIILSCSAKLKFTPTEQKQITIFQLIKSTAPSLEAFFIKNKPDLLVWVGGSLEKNLLRRISSTNALMILISTSPKDFTPPTFRIYPDTNRKLLKLFSHYYAADEKAASQLAKMGINASLIKVEGPLQEATIIPHIWEHETAGENFYGRPLWLAASITENEVKPLLEAHRLVILKSLRSLLIIGPSSLEIERKIYNISKALNLSVAHSKKNDLSNLNSNILISDSDQNIHKWYRLSPICFLGRSFFASGGGIDPYPAVAMGCALLYGPYVDNYSDRYEKLKANEAARIVYNIENLSEAVKNILNPNKAAEMAYSGWKIISEGAQLTDLLIEQILNHFDNIGR